MGIDAGEMAATCGAGFCSVSVAVADLLLSLASVAVMLTEFCAGGNSGARYCPVGEIVPTAALPPMAPFTDQINAGAPVAAAVKDCAVPPRSVPTEGVTVTTACCGAHSELSSPEQPVRKSARIPVRHIAMRFTASPFTTFAERNTGKAAATALLLSPAWINFCCDCGPGGQRIGN